MGRRTKVLVVLGAFAVAVAGCGPGVEDPFGTTPLTVDTVAGLRPVITGVTADRRQVPQFDTITLTVNLNAEYSNPFDAREVRLDAVFRGPDQIPMVMPGFWDPLRKVWQIRFAPTLTGEWGYRVTVTDHRGESDFVQDSFNATGTASHGWPVIGSEYDPDLSPRYFVYADGTPFYGVAHSVQRLFIGDEGQEEAEAMVGAGMNVVQWSVMDSVPFLQTSYDDYNGVQLQGIDAVMQNAAAKDLLVVFTVWDRRVLRGVTTVLGSTGRYTTNGFTRGWTVDRFFVDDEAWEWQKNLYRYIIARWGGIKSLGLWNPVELASHTEAGTHLDTWHQRVVEYFNETDPYRRPLTSSRGWDINQPAFQSTDLDWPEGHAVTSVASSTIFNFGDDAVSASSVVAEWTRKMWDRVEKPVWISQYADNQPELYPELSHNVSWAGLASGGVMQPAEISDPLGGFSILTQEMRRDYANFARFVSTLWMAEWHPVPVEITTSAPNIKSWGVVGPGGGVVWVQDVTMAGRPIAEVRANRDLRTGVTIKVRLPVSSFPTVTMYNTWTGQDIFEAAVNCQNVERTCTINLPPFEDDIALRFTIGGSGTPGEISAVVAGDEPPIITGNTTVRLDNTVRIRVNADVEDEVLVEGYNLRADTGPLTLAEITFQADEPGTFVVRLVGSGIELFTLTVR